jgi:zinc transport system substrate-binding protein
MKNKKFIVSLLLLSLLCGCVEQKEETSGIKVVATIAPLQEMVKTVGGDRVNVSVLIPPGAEPHSFEPTPSQMVQMADADLLVKNGAGLEFWMDKVLQSNENLTVIDTSEGVRTIREGEGAEDPHIWLSLRNSQLQVENIYRGLTKIDPENKDYYLQNRDSYLQKLRSLDQEFNRTFSNKTKKTFIVDHPAWSYFARDYGLMQIPLMENEQEPGPRYLAQIVDLARNENITTIFVEPEFNPKSAEVISREMNATVVSLDPLAGDYLENMRYSGQKIADSLA